MKFQNPTIHHSKVNTHTDTQTDKPKAICPSNFFKVGGIKIFTGFQVIERTQNCIENNQREVTHKILKPELWFLCMTHRLIMLNKCTKFY